MCADTRAAEAALDDLGAAVRVAAAGRPPHGPSDVIRRGRWIRRRRQGGKALLAVTMVVGAGVVATRIVPSLDAGPGIPGAELQVGASTPAPVVTTVPPSVMTGTVTVPGSGSTVAVTPTAPVTALPPSTPPPRGVVTTASPTTAPLPADDGKFIAPVNARTGDGFGFKAGRNHNGLDFLAPAGAPVVASRSGRVVTAGWDNGGYGNVVIIEHADGFRTLYAHLSAIDVKPDQLVGRGDRIGAVGATGSVTGPQLHFEIRINDVTVDPAPYLAAGATP